MPYKNTPAGFSTFTKNPRKLEISRKWLLKELGSKKQQTGSISSENGQLYSNVRRFRICSGGKTLSLCKSSFVPPVPFQHIPDR